jgi:hypothetical protein
MAFQLALMALPAVLGGTARCGADAGRQVILIPLTELTRSFIGAPAAAST